MTEYEEQLDELLDVYDDKEEVESGMVSKQHRIGRSIVERMLLEDDEMGGVYTEATGSQGSAKTSVNLAFASDIMKVHPNDKIFWSSTHNAPLQFLKLEDKDWHFMKWTDARVEFRDRERDGLELDLPVTEFGDFNELWSRAKPGKVNAVFFGDRMIWRKFIGFLRSKYEWSHVFFDEFGEVAPSEQQGDAWREIRKFSEDMKEVRKCNKNIFTNTQSTTDIDYRVRRKLMIRIFLPGAKADSKTRIYQKAIDNLKKDRIRGNQAYVDYDGSFGVVRFRDIFVPRKGRNWEARLGDEKFGKIQARKVDES